MLQKYKNLILGTYKALQQKTTLWIGTNPKQAKILQYTLFFVSITGILLALYISATHSYPYPKIYFLTLLCILAMYLSKYLKNFNKE